MARNRAQSLSTTFSSAGPSLTVPGGDVTFSLRRIGYGSSLAALGSATLIAESRPVDYLEVIPVAVQPLAAGPFPVR